MFQYELISAAIVEGDADETIRLTKLALGQGYPAKAILEKGLIVGMDLVAEKFREQKVIVPEVLLSSRAMHAGISIVQPYLKVAVPKGPFKIVIGTVAGDLHDIGKNLVKIMAVVVGIEVIDLGVDVTAKKFINAVRTEKPTFLMLSSLLTTTMWNMKEVITELKAKGMRDKVKVIVGGAPITAAFVKEIEADYFFKDAFEFKKFLEENVNKFIAK